MNNTLSIVIPVYNSEKTIKPTVNRIIETVKMINNVELLEIILVNDSSLDSSLEVCKSICKENQIVKLLNLSKNFGQHKALLAGMGKANGSYILRMDDDLQTLPEEIYKLVETLEKNDYDFVLANYEDKEVNLFRRLGTQVNNIMANFLIDKPLEVKLSSFCLYKKYVVKEMIKYDQAFPHIGGLGFRITKNVGNVTVKHNKREFGNSNYNFIKLFSLWLNGFTNYSVKPLRVSSVLGVLISFISFIFIIFLIFKKIYTPTAQIGWTSVIVAISFFGGIQLLSVGLIGEYIGRIFLCINKTPQYVIKDSYNLE